MACGLFGVNPLPEPMHTYVQLIHYRNEPWWNLNQNTKTLSLKLSSAKSQPQSFCPWVNAFKGIPPPKELSVIITGSTSSIFILYHFHPNWPVIYAGYWPRTAEVSSQCGHSGWYPSRIHSIWNNKTSHMMNIDGLVQERRNSSALAVELHLSCTNHWHGLRCHVMA